MSLKDWFGKGPKGDWVRMDTKGEIKGPCAREPGEGKPKCLPRSKAQAMSKKDRASAARRKRRQDPVADRPGKGGKPIMVKTKKEEVEYITEKSKPTNPALWSRAKAAARAKFDVYPSAYANGWAVRWYKKRGGGWRTVKEEAEVKPHKMYKGDKVVLAKNKADHDRLNKLGYTHDNPKTKKVEEEKGYCSCDCDCKQEVCKTCGMPRKITEKCWDGFKQVGMKKKGDKVVPNCVKETDLGVMIAKAQSDRIKRDWNKKSQSEKLDSLKKDRAELKKRMSEGENHSWRTDGHYKKDGTEYTGDQHAHEGQVMTGKTHTKDSENLYHFKDLSPEVKKKVLERMKMDESLVDKIMKSKTLNKRNYAYAAKELEKRMKKDPSKTKQSHAHDVASYVRNVDARKLAAEEKDSRDGGKYTSYQRQVQKRDKEKEQSAKKATKPGRTMPQLNIGMKHMTAAQRHAQPSAKKVKASVHGPAAYDSEAAKRRKAIERHQERQREKDYWDDDFDMTGCPLLEKLNPSMGIKKYINDFYKSDAPQFRGASKAKRRKMAVAAYLGAKRGE